MKIEIQAKYSDVVGSSSPAKEHKVKIVYDQENDNVELYDSSVKNGAPATNKYVVRSTLDTKETGRCKTTEVNATGTCSPIRWDQVARSEPFYAFGNEISPIEQEALAILDQLTPDDPGQAVALQTIKEKTAALAKWGPLTFISNWLKTLW
jgi:hypothetical protein